MRTSNFLPWQAVYAELLVLDARWPDIDRRDLWAAIEQYASRARRYGSVPHLPSPRPAASPSTSLTGTPCNDCGPTPEGP